MKIWMRRFQFFLKIIAKMRSKVLVLKGTGEYVELIHVTEVDGIKSYLVAFSDGETATVEEQELGTRQLVADRRLAFGISAAVAAALALLSVLAGGLPIEDLVQEAQSWLNETPRIN